MFSDQEFGEFNPALIMEAKDEVTDDQESQRAEHTMEFQPDLSGAAEDA